MVSALAIFGRRRAYATDVWCCCFGFCGHHYLVYVSGRVVLDFLSVITAYGFECSVNKSE